MKISFSDHITENYKTVDIHWRELYRVLISKYNYSPSIFRNGYRSRDNYLGGNKCIVLDIDEGWSYLQAVDWLDSRDLKALVATTKSHRKEKNGVVCDRFRIVLPLLESFNGTPLQFSDMMRNVFDYFEGKPDPAAKDAARFYYGNPGADYYYTDGQQVLSLEYLTRPRPKVVTQSSTTITTADPMIDWFVQNTHKGQRNTMLYRAYAWARDEGLNPSQIVRTINSQLGEPLDEEEVKQICRETG